MLKNQRILFASDLDNTLIHSYKVAEANEVCVEKNEAKALSYMSENAYRNLQEIHAGCLFAPITTRSLAQYQRIRLMRDDFPKYAITSNGAILLNDNQVDSVWFAESKRLIAPAIGELNQALSLLQADNNRCFEVRLVDEAFVFTKTNDIAWSMQNLKMQLDLRQVCVFNHGSKIYVIPAVLNKGTALKRLKNRIAADYIISAGDSEFDLPMLRKADLIFVPDHQMREALPKDKNVMTFHPDKHRYFADMITDVVRTMIIKK